MVNLGNTYRSQGRLSDAAEHFERALELSREAGELLTTPLLPGLEMPLARIFRD